MLWIASDNQYGIRASNRDKFFKDKERMDKMKRYWIAVTVAAALTAGALAQNGASGSASTNTSATAGQTGANVNANGNAQVSGGSANANASGQAEASRKGAKSQGNNSSSGGSSSEASLSSGTTLQAELTKSLDSKKAKPGEEVSARATQDVKSNGQVVVRKGSKLVGHVTEAQARSKENAESKLGIVFDHAVLKDGSQVNFNAVVQALAAAPSSPIPTADDVGMAAGGSSGVSHPQPMGGGGMVGGVAGAATSTVGSTVGGIGNTAGSVAGSTTGAVGAGVNGSLNSASRGVIGLQGLTLSSVASGTANAQGSVISSTTQNVKLDSGTQMVLQVTGSPQQ